MHLVLIVLNSQIEGRVCLSIVEKQVLYTSNSFFFFSVEVRLRTNYAYFTTREGIVAAGVGPATTQCN